MRVDEVTEEPVFALFAAPREEIIIEFSKNYETRYNTFSCTSIVGFGTNMTTDSIYFDTKQTQN
jgi:hypothetical protein